MMKSCDQNDETIWSHDWTKIEFGIIKRLVPFEILSGDVDSLVIFVIIVIVNFRKCQKSAHSFYPKFVPAPVKTNYPFHGHGHFKLALYCYWNVQIIMYTKKLENLDKTFLKHFSLYEIKYGVKLQTTETSLFQSNRVIHYFLKML
jgi:hypothetical protein